MQRTKNQVKSRKQQLLTVVMKLKSVSFLDCKAGAGRGKYGAVASLYILGGEGALNGEAKKSTEFFSDFLFL